MSDKKHDLVLWAFVAGAAIVMLSTIGTFACRTPSPVPSAIPGATGLYRIEDGPVTCYMYYERGLSCVRTR